MDVGPDGSLCRLTSSSYNGPCNVKIVREQTSAGVDYKLVFIGEKKSECESASEKSDEEPWTLESLDIELGILKPEKTKDKTEEVTAEKPYNRNTGNKPFNRRFRPNNTHRYRKSYVNSGQRNFKPYNNGNKSYNRQTNNTDSNDINPWIDPPILYTQYVVVDPTMNTPVSSSIDSTNPVGRGLLGNFQRNPIPPNFQTGYENCFPHNQNYWNGEYSNNYQHPGQNMPMSDKPPYKKYHNKKFWKNGPKPFNRNQDKNQKRRGRYGRRFYREQ